MTDTPILPGLDNLSPEGMIQGPGWSLRPPTTPISVGPTTQPPTDDSQPALPAPGSFAQRLAAAADSLKIPSGPGGWAKTLVAANMHALSGQPLATVNPQTQQQDSTQGQVTQSGSLAGNLGDAAAVGTVPSGGGALSGITRTLAARSQRLQQQKEDTSKEKTAELLRAETTQRIAASTRNMYRQDEQDRQAFYTDNDKFMKNLRERYITENDQDNISQDQLNNMLQKDPNFWKTHTGRATGQEPVMDGGKQKLDQNGRPIFSPTYSISNTQANAERTRPITDDEATYIKNNTGVNVSPNTELNATQFDNLMVRADSARQAKQKIEKANDEDMSEAQARQLNTVMQDPSIQHYMAMSPGEPLAGLYTAKKNTDAHLSAIDQMIAAVQKKSPGTPDQPNPTVQALQQKRQQFVQEGQNVDKAISGFNEKAKDDYTKRQDDQRKQAEVERHNRADEANKALEIKAKEGGFLGNPNAKTPEEFRASLDQQARAIVDLIGTGKAPINNPGYLLARKPEVLEAVAKAYPDFDISKVKGYQDMYTDYTKGKTSVQLESGATALGHLFELQQLNTAASHIPGTPAYNAYMNKVDTLSTELARFYGDSNIPGIANIKKTLTATLPGNREAAIKTQAQSMSDKFDNIEQKWRSGAPSAAYEAEMPGISLKAKQNRARLDPNYAAQHPELGVNTAAPAGNTGGTTGTWGSQFGAKPR